MTAPDGGIPETPNPIGAAIIDACVDFRPYDNAETANYPVGAATCRPQNDTATTDASVDFRPHDDKAELPVGAAISRPHDNAETANYPVGAATCRPQNIADSVIPPHIDSDTIAAICTASSRDSGDGAIGVVRLSGPGAFPIAGRIFRGKKPFDKIKPYTIGYGLIYDDLSEHDAVIDEVLILKMRAPKSYTREDVVEIHCHAGDEVQRRILRLAMRCGARAAEPGEFTKRAFLNGRIDLAQAEAVMDLIRAKSEAGASVALRQLEGALSEMLGAARNGLIGLIASLEAFLDFPEYDVEEKSIDETDGALMRIERGLDKLAGSFEYGRAAREGVTAVIAGRPNVGKSTLLNLLAGRDRAIVTDIPGTTRDVIDEYRTLGGFTVRFMDTAGVRETDDAVERIGVARTIEALGDADLAIIIFGADEGFTDGDARLIELSDGKKRVFVINKIDIAPPGAIGGIRDSIKNFASAFPPIIEASLVNGMGLECIEEAVKLLFAGQAVPGRGEAVLANERHYSLILRGLESIRRARATLGAGLPLEIPIVDMRETLDALGEITGETYSEDIIDRIFSEFCVGK